MINGYAEKNLVNNKKSVLTRFPKAHYGRKINLAFLATLQRKPNTSELRDFKDMINKLDVDDYHKDVVGHC